ncbi:uncharacterized protein G2W53_033030 [Senna tora]|uniref:Uncharacterized protein n=1 Tax=Senna tora TaxID=362788 RepID=A0A834T8U3_9FABA|nr:uncharacterized protein G2W53_033030 [Senna tora]
MHPVPLGGSLEGDWIASLLSFDYIGTMPSPQSEPSRLPSNPSLFRESSLNTTTANATQAPNSSRRVIFLEKLSTGK